MTGLRTVRLATWAGEVRQVQRIEVLRLNCPDHSRADRRAREHCETCHGKGYVLTPYGQSATLVARQIKRGAIP